MRAAHRFVDELERTIQVIAAVPERFALFDADLRRALFHRFPFYVVFRTSERDTVIIAIAHARRHPRFWSGRE